MAKQRRKSDQTGRLLAWYDAQGRDLPPSVAIAAIGQARFEGRMTAGRESAFLRELLVEWALRRFNEPSGSCDPPKIQRTGEQS